MKQPKTITFVFVLQARLATAKSGVSIPLQTATVAPPDPPVVVHSLTMHQKKLETELQQIEEKFDSKKRKFVESSSLFQEDLVRTCRKRIDEETFQSMVEQQTEIIKKERERERKRQAELLREVCLPIILNLYSLYLN